MNNIEFVLDASALMAFLHNEQGSDLVEQKILSGYLAMSTVNLCEVIGKLHEYGKDITSFEKRFFQLNIKLINLDYDIAKLAGELRTKTSQYGFSLGDRVCLALAKKFSAQAITADTLWTKVEPEYKILLIR